VADDPAIDGICGGSAFSELESGRMNTGFVYAFEEGPSVLQAEARLTATRAQADVPKPRDRRVDYDFKRRALRTPLPILSHPWLRTPHGKERVVRGAYLATNPAMVMAMVVDSVGRRWSSA
jgi:hypothetical protein